jgi:hypothetical protein
MVNLYFQFNLRRTFLRIICVLFFGYASIVGATCSLDSDAGIVNPECSKIEIPRNWEQEKFVWFKVCNGQVADFYQDQKQPLKLGSTEPQDASDWNVLRKLSSEFLETILFHEPYKSLIPDQGVRIVGAWFPLEVNLSNHVLAHPLRLRRSRFDAGINFRDLKTTRDLIVDNSFVKEGDLTLAGGEIGSHLCLDGLQANGLNFDGLVVHGSLDLKNASIQSMWLAGANIGGEFEVSDTLISSPNSSEEAPSLNLENITVGRDLKLLNLGVSDIKLTDAKVTKDLMLEGSLKQGSEKLLLHSVNLVNATVGASFRLGDTVFYKPLDAPQNWANESLLDLRNASFGNLDDGHEQCDFGDSLLCWNKWPKTVLLDGFDFKRIFTTSNNMIDRPSQFWLGLLERQPKFSHTAYNQLASAYSNTGSQSQANEVLFTEKLRELSVAKWAENLKLGSSLILNGFGYRFWYALIWLFIFTFLGWIILFISRKNRTDQVGFWYSLDMFVPGIRLNENHGKVKLGKRTTIYFYVHKIAGAILGSYVLANILGLLK